MDEAALLLLAIAVLAAAAATASRTVRDRLQRRREREEGALGGALLAAAQDVELGGEWPLPRSSRLMRECLAGESDVHINRLVEAGNVFCDVLEKLGPFAVILADVRANLKKIQSSPYRAADEVLVRPLLGMEVEKKAHPPKRLFDKSAATGLLWTTRFMRFWHHVCESSLQHYRSQPAAPVPFRKFIAEAYERVLLPFNGWFSERSFKLALPAIPVEWKLGALAPSAEVFWSDCIEWHTAIEEVLGRAQKMMDELELRDDTKSL